MIRAVLDTNVLVAGLRSSLGASFRLIQCITGARLEPAVTTPLALEYAAVLHRPGLLPASLTRGDIDSFIDWFVSVSSRHKVHYLWRPMLPDPKDDMVLEAAMASGALHIITFNTKDFSRAGELGVKVLTPAQFLIEQNV